VRREEGKSVEHLLHDGYQVKAGSKLDRRWRSSLAFPTSPSPGRIRSEALHGALKREFIEEQGWIPVGRVNPRVW
jgi:hypothetical protein